MDIWGWEGTDAVDRRRLLLCMALAAAWDDRRYADRVLVEATRFLKRRGDDDPVIREAREQLRSGFPRALCVEGAVRSSRPRPRLVSNRRAGYPTRAWADSTRT